MVTTHVLSLQKVLQISHRTLLKVQKPQVKAALHLIHILKLKGKRIDYKTRQDRDEETKEIASLTLQKHQTQFRY